MKLLSFQVVREGERGRESEREREEIEREEEGEAGGEGGVRGKRRRPFGPRWESFKVRDDGKRPAGSVCASICVLSFM